MAITGKMTLEQICEMTGELKDDVKKILENHTVNVDYIKNNGQQKDVNIYTCSETKNPDLKHMLIVRKEVDNRQCVTYELSLFGIMLIIALVRYHYIGIDNIRLFIFLM